MRNLVVDIYTDDGIQLWIHDEFEIWIPSGQVDNLKVEKI